METSLYVFEWKREPESPPRSIYEEDDFFSATDLTAFDYAESEALEENHNENKAEVVTKLLEDLDHLGQLDEFIKEEPFSGWLEEKIDLPIFENIHLESPRFIPLPRIFKSEDLKPLSVPVAPQHQQHVLPIQMQSNPDTTLLYQEFERVFDAVETSHGQLTPPQSPPLVVVPPSSPQTLTPLTPMQNGVYFAASPQIFLDATNITPVPQVHPVQQPRVNLELPPGTPQPDVALELAVVEELVRSRAENMVEIWNSSASSSNSVVTSPSSPSSSSSSGFSEYSSDPEWIPEPVQSGETFSASPLVEKSSRGRKRAGKPYSRVGPEDKKSRKKEQNKNAATRYRMKKKAEIEEILGEEKILLDHRTDLEAKVCDVQREIKCLKGLMRDLFRAKGLIK